MFFLFVYNPYFYECHMISVVHTDARRNR